MCRKNLNEKCVSYLSSSLCFVVFFLCWFVLIYLVVFFPLKRPIVQRIRTQECRVLWMKTETLHSILSFFHAVMHFEMGLTIQAKLVLSGYEKKRCSVQHSIIFAVVM